MANPRAALREALVAYGEGLGRVDLRPDLVIDTAWDLIEWLDDNGIDPGDPPSCGCGGYHWSCPGPDVEDEDDDRPEGFRSAPATPEVGHALSYLLTPEDIYCLTHGFVPVQPGGGCRLCEQGEIPEES